MLTDRLRQDAVKHLRKQDPVLRQVIDRAGPFDLKLRRHRFRTLVSSIISQQISTAAARTIQRRLNELVAPRPISPDVIAQLSDSEFQAAGISRQKVVYLRDLASKAAAGEIRFRRHGRMSDTEIIEELVAVKGIGVWTAQMFLIFSLGRLDVLPHDDLGVRSALRTLYQLGELPTRAECERIAQPWRPYASVAAWYCWRSLENPPEIDSAATNAAAKTVSRGR